MTLSSKLKNVKLPAQRSRKEPLWKGPEEDGITQGLLGRFLSCRERFRLLVVEGLKPADRFNSRMEFGQMWHVCEEAFAESSQVRNDNGLQWQTRLREYVQSLCAKYPLDQQQIADGYDKCKAMFPLYVQHWAKHPDVMNRTPLLQEQVFDVPYKLPSGRTVRLRGKWDSVDLVDNRGRKHLPMSEQGKVGSSTAGIWLQENKTKSSIDQQKIARQLTFDLQTMLYLVALQAWEDDNIHQGVFAGEAAGKGFEVGRGAKIVGVRYNVVRRSAHKSVESMLKKIEDDRKANRMGEWFARWNVEVSQSDIAKFRRECLDPILEQLCEWWDCVKYASENPGYNLFNDREAGHFRYPYGIYNPLEEGGSSDLDGYLNEGSEVGLSRTDNLFPELV